MGAKEEGGGRGQVCRVEQKAELVVKELAFCFSTGTLFAVAGSNVCLCRAAVLCERSVIRYKTTNV